MGGSAPGRYDGGVRAVVPYLILVLICASPALARLHDDDHEHKQEHGCPQSCDDHDPCTEDRCEGESCSHTPVDGPPCDDGDPCTRSDHCRAGRCVGVPVACADDGFACTDNVCVAGECTNVPIDSRCVGDDSCAHAVCAPARAGGDPTGCADDPDPLDGAECAEDGDACTSDLCGDGVCRHAPVDDQRTCHAVQDAFQRALSLAGMAGALTSGV